MQGSAKMEYSDHHLSPISPVLYTSISPAGTDSTFPGTPIKHEDGHFPEPPRKKQKRNKPTLSCEECVERKTKVRFWQCIMMFTPE